VIVSPIPVGVKVKEFSSRSPLRYEIPKQRSRKFRDLRSTFATSGKSREIVIACLKAATGILAPSCSSSFPCGAPRWRSSPTFRLAESSCGDSSQRSDNLRYAFEICEQGQLLSSFWSHRCSPSGARQHTNFRRLCSPRRRQHKSGYRRSRSGPQCPH
jgi:hypothetical protein